MFFNKKQLCFKKLYSCGPYYSRISGTREESLKVNPCKMETKFHSKEWEVKMFD